MIFRYARHTTNLSNIENFYTEIVGLEKIGEFKNHNNYNGLFLGHKNADWHLEFTTSNDKPTSKFDNDDLLVFYVNSMIELQAIEKVLQTKKIKTEVPENPYWAENGIMISDPDGFKVVFSLKHLFFNAKDDLTNLLVEKNIKNWSELIEFIRKLPYGRNQNRQDFSLVIKENKGTCSSKHAFLKKIADLNNFDNVQLILGIYNMNNLNTPKIGNIISDNQLEYIPEAHCYLKLNNKRIDITNNDSEINDLAIDIVLEIEIEPEQVATFKVDFHKDYLKKWLLDNKINKSFDEIWKVREMCIEKLEQSTHQINI